MDGGEIMSRKILYIVAAAWVLAFLWQTYAHAEWRLHRTCTVYSTDENTTMLSLEDALEIQKFIPDLRKCDAFWKCVEDREAGKVKHCYENDKRWR